MNIKWVGCSPSNYSIGRGGKTISKVVIHWIVGSLASADATFADGRRQASAHYGVGQDEIHQWVKEEDTAWHCGDFPTNQESIGIEHEGGPDLPISDKVYAQSIELVADICKRYNIPVDRDHIKKHSEIKATACPGTYDMDRLISGVIAKLSTTDPNQVKVNLGEPYGIQEVQAIKSMLADRDRTILELGEKAKTLDGFVAKWVEEWKLITGSSLVDVELEMAKLMSAEEAAQTFRDSIEECVGEFLKDDLLLEAHKTVRKQMSDLNGQISTLEQKLKDVKAPKGYEYKGVSGEWKLFSWLFKTVKYKRQVI